MTRRPFEAIYSLEDLKITAERLGNYFFDLQTMNFHNSTVSERIYPIDDSRGYFVTGERFWESSKRRYTVRKYEVENLREGEDFFSESKASEFEEFSTLREAHKYAEKVQGFAMLDKESFYL